MHATSDVRTISLPLMFLEVHLLLLLEWKPVHVAFCITKVQMLYHLYARVVTYAQHYHKVRGVESERDTQPRSRALGTHSLVHRVCTPYHGCAQHTHEELTIPRITQSPSQGPALP